MKAIQLKTVKVNLEVNSEGETAQLVRNNMEEILLTLSVSVWLQHGVWLIMQMQFNLLNITAEAFCGRWFQLQN